MTVTRTHVFARRRNSNLSHNRRVARPAVDDDDELKTPTITKKTTLKITTMPKHSSFPMIPASAPTSPAVTRKSDRNPPATPLRSLPPNCSTLLIALYPHYNHIDTLHVNISVVEWFKVAYSHPAHYMLEN